MLRAARAFLIDAMTELMAATDTGGERLLQARAMLRMARRVRLTCRAGFICISFFRCLAESSLILTSAAESNP